MGYAAECLDNAQGFAVLSVVMSASALIVPPLFGLMCGAAFLGLALASLRQYRRYRRACTIAALRAVYNRVPREVLMRYPERIWADPPP